MNYITLVQVVQADRHLNEYFPNEVLSQTLSILLLYKSAQVTVSAVLQHHVQLIIYNKGVEVTNDRAAFQLLHQLNLHQRFKETVIWQLARVNYLHDVDLIFMEGSKFVTIVLVGIVFREIELFAQIIRLLVYNGLGVLDVHLHGLETLDSVDDAVGTFSELGLLLEERPVRVILLNLLQCTVFFEQVFVL